MTVTVSEAVSEPVAAPSADRPALRALAIPETEPAPDLGAYCGRLRGAEAVGVVEQPTLSLALVTAAGGFAVNPVDPPYVSFGPRPTPSSELPDARAWAGRMVQAVLEILGGVRPVAQLVRWASADVYDGLQRRAALATVRPRPARRAMVRSVRVCEPADGVVEASAVVVARGRVQAVALRLEGVDGRWRMTALELG